MSAISPIEKGFILAGLACLLVAIGWYWVQATRQLGWDNFRRLFREPQFLLMLLGALLLVASNFV
jgi:hypothetical protein